MASRQSLRLDPASGGVLIVRKTLNGFSGGQMAGNYYGQTGRRTAGRTIPYRGPVSYRPDTDGHVPICQGIIDSLSTVCFSIKNTGFI